MLQIELIKAARLGSDTTSYSRVECIIDNDYFFTAHMNLLTMTCPGSAAVNLVEIKPHKCDDDGKITEFAVTLPLCKL